jgi:hypothetical protein
MYISVCSLQEKAICKSKLKGFIYGQAGELILGIFLLKIAGF